METVTGTHQDLNNLENFLTAVVQMKQLEHQWLLFNIYGMTTLEAESRGLTCFLRLFSYDNEIVDLVILNFLMDHSDAEFRGG